MIAPAGNSNGTGVVVPTGAVVKVVAPEVVLVIGLVINACCDTRAAPVLSGAITPLFVGLLYL